MPPAIVFRLQSRLQKLLPTLWPKRIGWRLTLGFGLLIGLMLVVLTIASLQIYRITTQSQRFASDDVQRLLQVQALSLQTERAGGALVRLLNAPKENRVREYIEIDARNRRIDDLIVALQEEKLSPEREDKLKHLITRRATFANAFIATVEQIELGDTGAAYRLLNEEVNPAQEVMLAASNDLLDYEREHIEAELALSQQRLEGVTRWVAGLSILAVALAIWLGIGTTQSVTVPLALLEKAARRIAVGDYSLPVPATSAQEVDRVGLALNSMTAAVAQREHQIVHLAFHDPLTGLPNRTALLAPSTKPTQVHNSLALMDLARLKGINETLGYSAGDTLILETAQRANQVFQDAATAGLIGAAPLVARLSGGTFAALFSAPHLEAVLELHARMEQAMVQPLWCSGHSVDLNLAYGFANAGRTSPPASVDTMLRNAEVALTTAKRSVTGYAWYNEAQEAARLEHLGLVSNLRTAVADSQLQMWLQPKYSLATGQAVGAEALVRWLHPQRGFISPAEFIPFAEQTGYIGMVTDWMLDQALSTLAIWGTTQPGLSISVNISTRDLQDPQFCERVQALTVRHGVAPQQLCLEIVESGLMDNPQSSVQVLHALRRLGVRLAIDDFGTGYSSLAYLQQLPVNELKIDRSFVDGVDRLPGTQRLVKTMIEMGHGMDLVVTAEGVETEGEKDTITRLGCDVMQGYLGSRPLHGDALQAWFNSLAPVTA